MSQRRRQERKSEVGVKEYLSIGLKGKAKSKALSLAETPKLNRPSEFNGASQERKEHWDTD
jgi:hypothetical protein